MVAFIRSWVLNILLFSYVYANVDPSSEDVKWLKAGRSVLVYLPTPDLPFCMFMLKFWSPFALVSRHWMEISRIQFDTFQLFFSHLNAELIRMLGKGISATR